MIIVLIFALLFFFFSLQFLARMTFSKEEYYGLDRASLATFMNFGRQDKGPWHFNYLYIHSDLMAIAVTAVLYLILSVVLVFLPVAYLMEEYRLMTMLKEEVERRGEDIEKRKSEW